MKRYAIVRNARSRREAEAYLPANYQVIHESEIVPPPWVAHGPMPLFVIAGTDYAGWTMDDYLIPRYASGLITCEEIDLSHPIMREVPVPGHSESLTEAEQASLLRSLERGE